MKIEESAITPWINYDEKSPQHLFLNKSITSSQPYILNSGGKQRSQTKTANVNLRPKRESISRTYKQRFLQQEPYICHDIGGELFATPEEHKVQEIRLNHYKSDSYSNLNSSVVIQRQRIKPKIKSSMSIADYVRHRPAISNFTPWRSQPQKRRVNQNVAPFENVKSILRQAKEINLSSGIII